MYLYLKALHIIFVVTWFAGLFYIPRLFIYSTEAETQPEVTRDVLRAQFSIMMRRLWFGITFPSAIITFILGHIVLYLGNWHLMLLEPEGRWLLLKYIFVWFLYGYHYSLHLIFKQIQQNIFRYSSQQLRIWNEVATIFLFAIVFLVVIKQSMSLVWGMLGLASFIAVLMSAIYLYKKWRKV